MPTRFDPTDVALVTAIELRTHLRLAQPNQGRLAGSRTLSASDIAGMETAFWQTYRGSAQRGQALFARLICLQSVLASRRLTDLMQDHAEHVLDVACAVACSLRLNQQWGFNRHKLITAIRVAVTDAPASFDDVLAEAA